MANKTGQGLADYAKTKLGTPYFYGSKMDVLTETFMSYMHKTYPGTVTLSYMATARNKGMVGKVCVDCSGLIGAYRGKHVGSAQLYSTATKRMKIADIAKFPVGTVLWKSGHVGVYIGLENGVPMCVEAKGINYGVVKTKVSATPWVNGLLFENDFTYKYEGTPSATYKTPNPYKEPTTNIKKGSKGEGARWVQYELQEAGYANPFVYDSISYKGVQVDGEIGKISVAATKSFQASSKCGTIDGIVGKATRNALKAN